MRAATRWWNRLLESLNTWSTATQIAPGRIQLELDQPDGSTRIVQIVMTRREWSDLVSTAWGEFEPAAADVRRTALALRPEERFLVYHHYELVPSTTDELPVDQDLVDLEELVRKHPDKKFSWMASSNHAELEAWFADYLEAFASCGRRENDSRSLLEFYGVPLLLSTDDAFHVLIDADQVVAVIDQQLEDARAAGYHHSVQLDHHVTRVNATSAYYRASFTRHREDGTEIGQLTATYLIGEGPGGRRIWALTVHRV